MSGVLKVVGQIAGAVAAVAGFVGLITGNPVLLAIAQVAAVVATAANIGAALLYKPPPARGSVAQLTIGPDSPGPYAMGEGYFAGVLRHDIAYGATLNKVPNPYRWMVVALCMAGPVEEVTAWVDLAPVTSWYSGFLYTTTSLGGSPVSAALVPNFAGAPGWSAASKLSGVAAIGWNLKFDKDGKRFASGVPRIGAYGKWVKVYDPRLDSTFPGGAGSQRIDNEATWAWSENPALHALAYAYGRYQNGKKVMGVGLPADGIDLIGAAAWANVCDANGWTIFGVIGEPGDRWANLKDICAAGGCDPVFAGGQLGWKFSAPKIALDTITEADLAEDDQSVTAMASWRDRINTVIPKYRSAAHDWEMVDAEPVGVPAYVAEDGEVKQVNWPFNFVKNANQAARLAAYKLMDARELQPIELTCGPRLRAYRPGECLHLDIPSLGLDTLAVILKRDLDPSKMTVKLVLIGETAAKHPYALGLTGTPPPTPAIGQTSEERDQLAAAAGDPAGWQAVIIRNASVKNPRTTANVARALLTASESGGTATISVARHDWDYPDGTADVTRDLATISFTASSVATTYFVYFDDATLTDTAPTYLATTNPALSQNSGDNPSRHALGTVLVPATGSAGSSSGGDNFGYGYDLNIYL